MKPQYARDRGFSLIEMLVAMLVTVIVSGAIFGLMTVGQTAFKTQPARADQQQNLRAAMDSIQRDISAAGGQISPWVQAFTAGDGPAETGPALLNAGPGGSDFLQIFGADGACPELTVDGNGPTASGPCSLASPCPGGCTAPGTGVCAANAFSETAVPACYGPGPVPPAGNGPVLVALTSPASFYVGVAAPTGFPPPGPTPIYMDFAAFPQPTRLHRCGPLAPPPTTCVAPPGVSLPPTDLVTIAAVQVIRYEIAPDPTDQVLALWRSATGGVNLGTGVYTPANTQPSNAAGGWVLVARGVEDLGVWYVLAGNPVPNPAPPVPALPTAIPGNSPAVVVQGNFGTLVQQVRVTLTGRTLLEGGRDPVAGDQDFRTRLTGAATPRAALTALAGAPAPFTWQ